ncbi:hypothetical protein L1987_64966 [Smallanthus sonchifolius]|uniref:Uncharacterized protein n=1 Tax=Smallanthus sonchifolius TaxID=185202 RepID=A0ACB9BT27_9ASTR|nr:hypothetical protein L1987_64966 [Smallanthus sonchifolius]
MQEELLQFKKLNVWHLVDLPERKYTIGTKWVFHNKRADRGIVIRNKACLVVQGFYQEKGLDYYEVFAHVSRIEAIRIFLACASYKKFKVYQMDVKIAFLYGVVKEELDKALYGLHQAPHAWYETLSTHLTSIGFVHGTIDKTLFLKKFDSDLLIVQVYVDDIIYGSTNENLYKDFEAVIKLKFKAKYVKDILTKFKMNDCKSASTPIAPHEPLNVDLSRVEVNQKAYRSMTGSLMNLIVSRPDIMFKVFSCAIYQAAPKESHESAVKRIFCYLKGRVNLGFWYPSDSEFNSYAYTDSDYGGCNLDKKSTSGGCQFLGERLVSWQCKKQTNVFTSTAKAEYTAVSSCCSQVIWIQHQLMDGLWNQFLGDPDLL